MEKYIELIHSVVPTFENEYLDRPFSDAGIASIDLVTIRADLEKHIGKTIPDSQWMNFAAMSEVISYCQSLNGKAVSTNATVDNSVFEREMTINMPQMALEALSENWLFKELGGIHWEMLCNGLQEKSNDLRDELGNRLYATFVRIRTNSSEPLSSFQENEEIKIKGTINRYGNSMYYSQIEIGADGKHIHANLMTSFSIINDADNKKLQKSQPDAKVNLIEECEAIPNLGNDYRLIKKGEVNHIMIDDVTFKVEEDFIFEIEYELNPYYDLNGVGLLYFASYPTINDVCEARYFNEERSLEERWEQTYYTMARDILYYANCNIDDPIIYRLHSFEFIEGDRVKISSSLYRKSDNQLMAKLFTIKSKKK